MDKKSIIEDLNLIFRDVMDNDSIELKPEYSAKDIEEWDSLNHITVIVQIEKKFGIKFKALEIQNLKNVEGLIEAVHSKL